MRINFLSNVTKAIQNTMEQGTKDCLQLGDDFEQLCGGLSIIPVALVSTGLQVVKQPLMVIDRIASAVINLLGALFSERCREDLVKELKGAITQTFCYGPKQILMSPVMLYNTVRKLGQYMH